MRTSLVLAAALLSAGWKSVPGRGTQPDDLDQYSLSPELVQRYAATYLPAIHACYVENAPTGGTGELALHFVVIPRGDVAIIAIDAPGVTGARYARMSNCIREAAKGWHFPVRSGNTHATMPLHFHRLVVPNSGPYPSCPSPRGCATQSTRVATPPAPRRR